jgi:flagellar motility protein MotE (MotC chaperone)
MTQVKLRLTLPVPRILPVTILAMALLFVVKSGSLVRATALPAASVPLPAKAHSPLPARPEPARPQPSTEAEKPPIATTRVEPVTDPPVSDSERALLTDLRQRRIALDARESKLAARESALGAVEKRLSARVAELADLQTRIEAMEKQRQTREELNWRGLVKLYETMKPKDAAQIFNDLDFAVLLPVLDRMKEAKASPIIAAMQPDRARQVTVELAKQRLVSNTINPRNPSALPTGG